MGFFRNPQAQTPGTSQAPSGPSAPSGGPFGGTPGTGSDPFAPKEKPTQFFDISKDDEMKPPSENDDEDKGGPPKPDAPGGRTRRVIKPFNNGTGTSSSGIPVQPVVTPPGPGDTNPFQSSSSSGGPKPDPDGSRIQVPRQQHAQADPVREIPGSQNNPTRAHGPDRKSTRLNSSHRSLSRMPSSA